MIRICRALILLALAVLFLDGQNPTTSADISGDGAAHQFLSSGSARWITVIAPPSNSTTTCGTSSIAGCPRIGDSTISTSRGTILQPGQSAYFPESPGTNRYSLNQWYYLVQSGDKLIITYAN